jgi:outer membrane protein assembly factor BamB
LCSFALILRSFALTRRRVRFFRLFQVGLDGTVYVGSNDHFVYALSHDGSEKWRFETKGPVISSPAVLSDGGIVVGSQDSAVYGIAVDGKQAWKYELGMAKTSSPAVVIPEGATGKNTTVYIGCMCGALFCLDCSVGQWPIHSCRIG